MSKLVTKIKQTRHNWWEQFKVFCSIKGYKYYKPPQEIKYGYPAPGSCPITPEDRPMWFKVDWKMPFRDSEFNIGAKDKTEPDQIEHMMPDFKRFNNDGRFDHQNIHHPLVTPHGKKVKQDFNEELNEDDKIKSLKEFMTSRPALTELEVRENEWANLNYLEDVYNPTYVLIHERSVNAIDNEGRF